MGLREIEEKRVIDSVLKGDRLACKKLIEHYQQLVFHIVYRMLPGDYEREEVCQEVFIKVFKNLAGFKHKSKLSTWIGRIACNHCINYLRKKNINLFEETDFMQEKTYYDYHGEGVYDIANNPEDVTNRHMVRDIVAKCIEKLPPIYKTIVTLYHLQDFSYTEIANTLQMPEGTVKNYLFRARQILKGYLKQEEILC